MVRTRAYSCLGTYRKVVAARAPRKVLGSSTSATNFTSPSWRKEREKYILCHLMTQMMKKNRTSLFILD
ncbi:PCNA-associated factor-like isoform X2 [Myotis yumanensis]|uniref:PCNA-associated factor-like isoform X2 n=1 Tax=Myotis yumanensis TaxID=159337 RepID=UPI0038D1048B